MFLLSCIWDEKREQEVNKPGKVTKRCSQTCVLYSIYQGRSQRDAVRLVSSTVFTREGHIKMQSDLCPLQYLPGKVTKRCSQTCVLYSIYQGRSHKDADRKSH